MTTAVRQVLLSLVLSGLLFSPLQETGKASQSRHQAFVAKLVAAAIERTSHSVRYDGSYVGIPYPSGDVPVGTGV